MSFSYNPFLIITSSFNISQTFCVVFTIFERNCHNFINLSLNKSNLVNLGQKYNKLYKGKSTGLKFIVRGVLSIIMVVKIEGLSDIIRTAIALPLASAMFFGTVDINQNNSLEFRANYASAGDNALDIGTEYYKTFHREQKPQMPCGPLKKVEATLLESYKESNTEMGLANNGSLVNVYSGQENSWTMTTTDVNKLSCLMMLGTVWISGVKTISEGGTEYVVPLPLPEPEQTADGLKEKVICPPGALPRNEAIDDLKKTYGQYPTSRGMTMQNQLGMSGMIEIAAKFDEDGVDKDGKTKLRYNGEKWTILLSMGSNGDICTRKVISGTAWDKFKAKKDGKISF